MLNLTQKEKMLLQDQRKHEQMCVQKYKDYANQAQDPQLKQLFNSYSNTEQQHLNTINQILSGQVPNTNQQQGQSNNQAHQFMQGQGAGNPKDEALCNDMLMTEKYVSNAYDTAVFEFTDTNVRKTLNHIQKEEQEHGEGLFNYMKSRGMYNPQ